MILAARKDLVDQFHELKLSIDQEYKENYTKAKRMFNKYNKPQKPKKV